MPAMNVENMSVPTNDSAMAVFLPPRMAVNAPAIQHVAAAMA
jgi:hypothetical protein